MEKDEPHHITSMITELDHSHTSLNIPKHASHIAGTCYDLSVVDETTAAKVSRVGAQFTGASSIRPVLVIEVIYRANVVEATASDKVTRW